MDIKQMKRLSIIWGILILTLLLGFTIIAIIYKNESQKYKEFETTIENNVQAYVEENSLYPEESQTYTLDELLENEIILTKVVEDKECEGYVIIKNDNQSFSYDAYIKCGNYKTLGY